MVNSGGTERDSGADAGLDADDLLSRARTEQSAQQRRRRRWQEETGRESQSIESALLAAIGQTASLGLPDGSELNGSVVAVGIDVVELGSPHVTWWVAAGHIHWAATDRALPGSGAERDDVTLAELCADLVGLDQVVEVVLASGTAFDGNVVATGTSLVITRPDGRTLVLRWDSVACVGRRLRVE